MNCPNCKTFALKQKELETQLPARECDCCNGVWISSTNYWRWLSVHGDNLPELPEQATAKLDVVETTKVKICPECGHFLTRRKVGHGLKFHIDRCTTCGGIWLEQNEWEVLKSRNLHDEIHLVFSEAWQEDILRKEHQAFYQAKASDILGDEDSHKLNELKEWIDSHQQKSFILAYLNNKDI